jgi:hypothetical protein
MKKLVFTLAVLAGFAMQALAYDFQSGNLLYTIISTNPPRVSLDGHVDGTNAQGELIIPEMVEYDGVTYTVTKIGDEAFSRCIYLTGDLVIPNTVTHIGKEAFLSCSGFSGQLVIPNTVDVIDHGAFCNCWGLTGDLIIPNSVHYLGARAFHWCSGFDGQLVLPDSITEIYAFTFSGCSGLSGTLTIPNTVTSIAAEAFCDCRGFTGDLVIPNSVTELSAGNPYVNTLMGAFQYCSGFNGRLVLSENLEVIHGNTAGGCFYGCSNLTGDLVLPNTLKEIGGDAFYGCSGLTGELVFPDSLNYIGIGAFEGCSGFTGRLVFPETVEQINDNAFARCSGFTDVELHHQVFYQHNFGDHVFSGWSFTNLDIPEGWTTTGKYTFSDCSNLVSVHLPESLFFIGGRAFLNCSSLSEINVPEGVKEIGYGAFSGCTHLAEFDFPENLTAISGAAFSHCVSLSGDLIIPDYLERMEAYAFDSCVGFNRLVMGAHVNYIAEPAFENTEFELIIIKAMVPPVLERKPNQNAWHFPVDIPIMVPCGTLEAYHNAEGWSEFTNITEDCGGLPVFNGSEWYYEILNENGSITYQHLEYAADTTVSHKDVKIIIRTNTLYDKGRSTEVTREYVYEEDNKVYWWNKDLQEFTVLYDLGALQGDEWEIKVGMESLTMHVDAVDQYYYDGRLFKLLQVSDEGDLFSGTIVCGIGHLTSFFPERLMTRGMNYRVEGIRCYWREGELVFKYGDKDCDEVYEEWHNGIEEDGPSTGSGALTVYPNPTDGVLIVETQCFASQPTQTYHITNLMGQTLMSGNITAENQQIDVSGLPEGMYFISIGNMTRKFVVER